MRVLKARRCPRGSQVNHATHKLMQFGSNLCSNQKLYVVNYEGGFAFDTVIAMRVKMPFLFHLWL